MNRLHNSRHKQNKRYKEGVPSSLPNIISWTNIISGWSSFIPPSITSFTGIQSIKHWLTDLYLLAINRLFQSVSFLWLRSAGSCPWIWWVRGWKGWGYESHSPMSIYSLSQRMIHGTGTSSHTSTPQSCPIVCPKMINGAFASKLHATPSLETSCIKGESTPSCAAASLMRKPSTFFMTAMPYL